MNMEMRFMDEAVRLSFEGMRANAGGPFGAVVVLEGEIVGRGFNDVLRTLDPTAHAEVLAIRDACARLARVDLSDCVLYASAEPCPMCLAAACWARIPRVYFANSQAEVAAIGFDDHAIHEAVASPERSRMIDLVHVEAPQALEALAEWQAKPDKVMY
jgi:guanine deaminase